MKKSTFVKVGLFIVGAFLLAPKKKEIKIGHCSPELDEASRKLHSL